MTSKVSLRAYLLHVFVTSFVPLYQVLNKELPEGVNIVYESVGGAMFDLCLNALATYGRLIVIGMVSQVISQSQNSCQCSSRCGHHAISV